MKLTISEPEVAVAVAEWLDRRGIKVNAADLVLCFVGEETVRTQVGYVIELKEWPCAVRK